MDKRVQQEIDKTLDCFEDGLDIPVNPMFMQGLNSRMARLQVKQVSGHQRRISYPVVIVILLVLNLGTGLLSFKAKAWSSVSEASNSPASILAAEYGLGQQIQLSF